GLPLVIQVFNTVPGGAGGFTWGNDIYFPAGEYDTSSNLGLAAIAHELVHVQQFNELGGYGFIQKYASDYVASIKSQLPPDAVFTATPNPATGAEFWGDKIAASKYLYSLLVWGQGIANNFKDVDLGKAYTDISLEVEARKKRDQLLRDLIDGKLSNPCK